MFERLYAVRRAQPIAPASGLPPPEMSAPPEPSSVTRRSRQREQTRRVILDAAEELLAQGYEQFSMRKLAARCGYTPPTLYHYFEDKLHLLDDLLELRTRELVVALRRVQVPSDAVEALRLLFRAFAEWGARNPNHYALLTVHRQRAETLPIAEEARRLLQRPVEALAEAGRLRTDVETAKQSFWVLVHGLISLNGSRPDVEWSPDLGEQALDAMIRGLVRPELAK